MHLAGLRSGGSQVEKSMNILIVEDLPSDAELIEREIKAVLPDYIMQRVETRGEFIEALRTFAPDLILADYTLPSFDGLTALNLAQIHAPETPFILVTGSVNEETAVACMKAGAWDYVLKDHIRRLGGAILGSLDLRKVRMDRKRAETALRQSEAQLRKANEVGRLGSWSVDTHGTFTWSEEMYRHFGMDASTVIDEEVLMSRVHPDDRQALQDWIVDCWLGQAANELDTRIVHPDGTVRYLTGRGEVQRDEAGNAVSITGIILDITERKNAELALSAAKERAERSERLKDAFIANISHEIRTPLNIILGYTDIISHVYQPSGDEEFGECVESIRQGGVRLMRTVDMILNFSRLQVGEFTLHLTDLSLSHVVRKLVKDFKPFAEEKGITLTHTDECVDATIRADEYCIVQALSNVLDNAIKFTSQGGVQLRIFQNTEGSVCVSCRDTGIGIAEEYLPALFSQYSQEEVGFSRSYDGLGLGMALVKEYLALNNASITVESRKGVGSTFTMTFQGNCPGAREG
jgi:PAS domain S-box-containing protein